MGFFNRSSKEAETAQGNTMSDSEMLAIMNAFAAAYLSDDMDTYKRLQPKVHDVGEQLNDQGGMKAMRKMHSHFSGSAARHIEREWSGIGSWQG
jgi:hypothetical protein